MPVLSESTRPTRPGLMPLVCHTFSDLATVIEEVHDLFDALERAPGPALDPDRLEVLKLAVHEWLANLVQHADFGGHQPDLRLRIQQDDDRVRCVIEDNSRGFDFSLQLVRQQYCLANAATPPERGRGLLLIVTCTEKLSYRPVLQDSGGDGFSTAPLQRLEFVVPPFPPLDTVAAEAAFDLPRADADRPWQVLEGARYQDACPPESHLVAGPSAATGSSMDS
jgi:anti-sigma regulatory factor (Ser/Thr protein kinase)